MPITPATKPAQPGRKRISLVHVCASAVDHKLIRRCPPAQEYLTPLDEIHGGWRWNFQPVTQKGCDPPHSIRPTPSGVKVISTSSHSLYFSAGRV